VEEQALSFISKYFNGARMPVSSLKHPLTRDALEFRRPVRINTGKAESQWLGSLVLILAAHGGKWQAVPWRLIRNTYMRYDILTKAKLRSEKMLPEIPKEENVVIYELGAGTPIDELYNGLRHMIERGLLEVITQDKEDFLFPTNALLKCTPEPFNMMSAGSS
jgi:hypothetical protein